jgi:tripartite-type tricarboxylate transporter receptor subunit TctC
MFSELFNSLAGTKMTHVPYKGNPQAGAALLAGEVSVLFDTAVLAMANLKSDRVTAIAITGKARSPLAPEVPTFAESGLPAFDAAVWFGIMAPARTPKAVIDKLNAEVNEVLKAQDVRARLTGGAVEIVGGTPQQFANLIRSDVQRWKRVAQEAGVKAE